MNENGIQYMQRLSPPLKHRFSDFPIESPNKRLQHVLITTSPRLGNSRTLIKTCAAGDFK